MFAGQEYLPGHFIDIQHAGNELGDPIRRTTASFSVTDPTVRQSLLADPGPVPIEVTFIFSRDKGLTWTAAGGKHLGRLSKPEITNGQYRVEIETYRGDADRGQTGSLVALSPGAEERGSCV